MDINVYEVIRLPLLTEKAQRLNHDLKKLVLEVHPQANKPLIKQALKKIFNVEVATVCVQVRKGKNKNIMRSRLTTRNTHRKIAIITLKKGYKLDLFGSGEGAAAQKSETPEKKTE
jgi:large subunit ribosomal protein L23